MSKYYKAEEVERLIENVINVMIGKEEPIETALSDLPTIEIDEDCISREQAITAYFTAGDVYKALKSLPSITPKEYTDIDDFVEVVRCKNCKFRIGGYHNLDCRWDSGSIPEEDDYCSYGQLEDSPLDDMFAEPLKKLDGLKVERKDNE